MSSELGKFIRWVNQELQKETSTFKVKGYELAGVAITNLSKKRYEELTGGKVS